ncbi:formate dehydrogenase subunit gamma [Mangrovibrevibacter kandeliae]|uniref:formate dehydrogenase subunit gamma n=1 Tax=Mangrovibrevibacter kandeliae TaxID=2968473 RepID=UPI002118EA67|nr:MULTISPECIES: formate dehydrogenase subunit gamma [unclassified Aurantimonas]MCQ8783348.1 formate dehydrogenase subunit gamma [Aurantimonas sp. CSK15Z-1]MCW4116137.1 formate dehydrogenase subunit gamma [Aurantimonas sp. MSK8Z-1]
MGYAHAFDPEDAAAIIDELKHLEGPLLPILHAFQARYGHVSEAAIQLIAGGLNLSRAEVYGVVSFYHDFHEAPHGRHVLKVCRAESCQAAGGDAIAASIEDALGIKFGETSSDGQVTLEAVYCLGLCAASPSAMLDGRLVARLTEAKVSALVEEVRL